MAPREQDQEQLIDDVAVGNIEVVLQGREVDPAVDVLLDVFEGVLANLADELGSHGVVYKVSVGAKDIAACAGGGRALLIGVSVRAMLLGLRRCWRWWRA